jgi:PAS domain S-box-containing protein
MTHDETPQGGRPTPRRWTWIVTPILWVGLATLVRAVLKPFGGEGVPYLTFYFAVLAAAWSGGLLSGVIAIVLSLLLALPFSPGSLSDRISSEVFSFDALRFLTLSLAVTIVCQALRRSRDRARIQQQELEIMFASIGDAVITTDAQGRVTRMNPAAVLLTGWTEGDARGRFIEDVFQIVNEDTRITVESPVRRVLHSHLTGDLAIHTILIARDNSERSIDDSAAPITDARRGVTGVVLIFRDISARRVAEREKKRIEAEIEDSRARLGLALGAAGMGTWRAAPSTRTAVRDAGFQRILGRTEDGATPTDFFASVHPDDAPAMHDAFDRALAEHTSYEVEVRILRPDGTVRWIREKGRLVGEPGKEELAGVTVDITEEKNAERRVYELLLELREADRKKDEFLATLAHELRGPLAPLRSALEVLNFAKNPAEANAIARATLDRQLGQLARLVEDLLDVSRISRGRIELRKERTELASAIYQAQEVCRPLAEASGQTLIVSVPEVPIFLDADPVRLTQVFTNLLANACKYTPAGGRIEVRAERDGETAWIRFTDNGLGIPPEMIHRIFDMFTQVEATKAQAQGGLGIGLSLVRSLLGLHGGTIEAHSDGLGHGSTFTVRMPALAEGILAVSAPLAALRGTPAKRRVLVADDNRDGAAALGLLLTLAGHDAHFAHDGVEAVAVAERVRPDVVLLDIGMPRLNGLEAARLIREQPWGSSMMLVALTGWGQEEDRRKSKTAGFDHHMVKPIDYLTLARLLAEDGRS